MKQGSHPPYGPVAFRDRATGRVTLTRSTLVSRAADKTVEVDQSTYRVIDVDVSSDSHPFWTGLARARDSGGRVETFERRYGRKA